MRFVCMVMQGSLLSTPPQDASDDALWGAVCACLRDDAALINVWLDSPPQTNDVRRAATLIAVGHWLADRFFGLPIRTSELGASAGLNLQWDHYALAIGGHRFGPDDAALTLKPEWAGPLPPATPPQVTNRAGVDLNPLHPARPEDALRLLAYLWPDQPQRLALTRAAIAATRSPVDRADAIDWLAHRLPHRNGELHLIYTTVAWQYFPHEKQKLGTAMITATGSKATLDHPLAWFSMENDGGPNGAALTLRLWPGNMTIPMGRADFHGRWIDWGVD